MSSIRFILIAVFTVAATATTSEGYRIDEDGNGKPLHWRFSSMPVRYQIAASNVPGGSAGEDAVRRGFASWSDASSNLTVRFDGYTSNRTTANDGTNRVYWIHDSWPHDRSLLAMTMRFFRTSDGSIVDSDVVFNGDHYSWSVGGHGHDIENTVAHEAGHLLGLGHSSEDRSTMYGNSFAGETYKRSLSQDDLQGLDAIYGGVAGIVGGIGPELGGGGEGTSLSGAGSGGGGGGCHIGPITASGSRSAPWSLAGLLVMLFRRRRAALGRLETETAG